MIVTSGTFLKPADQSHPAWLYRKWATAVPDNLSISLTGLILIWQNVSFCCLAPFQAFDGAHPCLYRMWVTTMHYTLSSLDWAHPWLYRLWVTATPVTLLSLLTGPILGSSACKLLLSLAPYQSLFWAHHLLYRKWAFALLTPFLPTAQTHPWLYSLWVTAIFVTLLSLLIRLSLTPAVGESLICLALFQPLTYLTLCSAIGESLLPYTQAYTLLSLLHWPIQPQPLTYFNFGCAVCESLLYLLFLKNLSLPLGSADSECLLSHHFFYTCG